MTFFRVEKRFSGRSGVNKTLLKYRWLKPFDCTESLNHCSCRLSSETNNRSFLNNLWVPFGEKEGRLYRPGNVDRGLKCGCHCPNTKCPWLPSVVSQIDSILLIIARLRARVDIKPPYTRWPSKLCLMLGECSYLNVMCCSLFLWFSTKRSPRHCTLNPERFTLHRLYLKSGWRMA